MSKWFKIVLHLNGRVLASNWQKFPGECLFKIQLLFAVVFHYKLHAFINNDVVNHYSALH